MVKELTKGGRAWHVLAPTRSRSGEAQIMEILWAHGDATAEQIRELLPDRPHDSTVRTLLRILESKGYVAREGPGRPLLYKAEVSRSKAQRTALQRLLGRLFRGSPEALALRLLEDRHLTPEQFEEIARNASIPPPEPRSNPPSSGRKPAGRRTDDRGKGAPK